MTKKRKCIAVLIEKPNKNYQADILRGIYSAAFGRGMNVAVFSVTLPRSREKYHEGEMNIFTLPGDYTKFAGVIYLPDTIDYPSRDKVITEPLLRAAGEHNIPVVTIDYKIDGIPCYYCDDSKVVKAMVRHLVEKHGCCDIAYMTGYKGHPHAEMRLKAFKEAMHECGLPVHKGRTYYGDFWYDEGENFVKALLADKRGLPDAIICASSHMADSVYSALFDRGLRVPRDILLAGYDEYTDTPSLMTSTMRRTENMGIDACTGLFSLMEGRSIPEITYTKCDFSGNFAYTCGCKASYDYNINSFKQDDRYEFSDFFSEFNTMSESLISSENLREMFWTANWFTFSLDDIKSIYCCMCQDASTPDLSMEENNIRTEYTQQMLIAYSRINHDDGSHDDFVGTDRSFALSEIFPPLFDAEGEPAAYVFRPLHFENRCFGYAVISYGNRIQAPSVIFDHWINTLSNAIESQRRLSIMSYLYKKTKKDSITDLMTGLINRNGFNLMLPTLIEEAKKNNKQFLLIMADLNGLKYVNDTFGHAEGDEFIKTASGAMARTWIGGASCEKNFRIGGDEFVKVAYGDFSAETINEFRGALNDYLDLCSKNKPYPIYMPLGFCLCEADEEFDGEKMLSVADKHMYIDKERLKKETGFDPKRN